MNNNRLKIGEFSRLGRVTVRALRHYEEIGLLRPEIIDRETGYRYTIEHGGYKPQDIDIEYCEKVTCKGVGSDIIRFKDIPEVPKAADHHSGSCGDKLAKYEHQT